MCGFGGLCKGLECLGRGLGWFGVEGFRDSGPIVLKCSVVPSVPF